MTSEKKTEELDLLKLLLNGIQVVRNNFYSLLFFFALGSAIGLMRYYTARKVYENTTVLSSKILTETYSKILFEGVNRHLEEGDYGIVAKQLNASVNVVRSVQRLKIESLRKEASAGGEDSDRFRVTADVYDQSILDSLQYGISYFLENNEYAKVRVEQTRATAKQMLTNVDSEISDMETLKKSISSGEFFQSLKGNMMFDPSEINSKILELKEKKLAYQNTLALSNSVFVISPFSAFQHQSRPRLIVSTAAGASIGLALVALFIAFKAIRKLLRMAESAS